MKKKSQSKTAVTRRTFSAGLGAAGIVAGTTPFNIVRAQGATLKVGVLLPRSGYQASIGQDCQRGVDISAGILKDLGLPSLQIMERRLRRARRMRWYVTPRLSTLISARRPSADAQRRKSRRVLRRRAGAR